MSKSVVLQLIDSFNQGGSERQALQLTRLLADSGKFNIQLASLSPDGILRPSIDDLGLPDIPTFPLTSFYDRNAVKQLRRLVAWLRKSKVDVLHTHDFYTNVFGMTAGALAKVPVRIASMRETAGMRTRAQLKAQRIAFSLAHHVVANSKAVREKLMADGVRPGKVSVLYNGLDMNRLTSTASRSEILRSLGLDGSGKQAPQFVTIVANMRHDVKDYPMFLRAARQVKDVVPDAGFLLAGEGELMPSLRTLAVELDIANSTFFLGRSENVGDLLSISSVCVLSSKAEGFSNSILEYMAAGRPVVVTDVGGAREVVVEGETGYLVPSGNHHLMATRIIGLLSEREKAGSMGSKGRALVQAKFSCVAQLASAEQLYGRLLGHSSNK